MADDNARCPRSAAETLITVFGVLASVGVGALIFWWATKSRAPALGYTRVQPQYIPPVHTSVYEPPVPDLSPVVDQIRAHIRAANAGTPGEATIAQALLDDAESRHGVALARVCDVPRLRSLIARVQAKTG